MVLGTRLGEGSSFFDEAYAPTSHFLHVDVDAAVFGRSYARCQTVGIQAEIKRFLQRLLSAIRPAALDSTLVQAPHTAASWVNLAAADFSHPVVAHRVHPLALMQAVQSRVVEGSDACVFAESGNAFVWATHFLRFSDPRRFRVSTGQGAMGHMTTGVLGAAIASGKPCVALVGDGSMLMGNEVNTAVKFGLPIVWIVLNDARYGMCAQGMASLGLTADADFPEVDFATLACALGARGARVDCEDQIGPALAAALDARSPYVLDMRIDRQACPPSAKRNRGLQAQMVFPTSH
jgi:thiamine pyrophosphate-dependent acetolactate synthase large subunit-like protein